LSLYTRLDNYDSEEELQEFHQELSDRFGAVPPQVEDLFRTVRSRKMAVALGFEKMLLRDNVLKCFFVPNHESPYFQSDVFMKIMQFIQTETNKAKLKQVGKNGILVVTDMTSMEKLLAFVQKLHAFATAKNNEAVLLP